MFDGLLSEGIGLLIGIIISTLGGTVYLSKKFNAWMTKHKLRRGVFATSDVYDTLQKTQHALGAKKALLIAAHNGGAFINPLHPPHITILAETHEHDKETTKEHWQNRVADKGIVNMLSALLTEERLVTNTKTNKGAIRREMEKDNTEGLVIQYIGIMGAMLVYATFAFDEGRKLTSSDIIEIENFVNIVKKKY